MFQLLSIWVLALLLPQQQVPKLSPEAEITVITCGPGEIEAFTAYGHSAMRVNDPMLGFDRVYNYGTFDFNTPNFYGKFATGRLDYMLSVSTFNRFIAEYAYEGRWVKEQVLNLDQEQKQAIFSFLENNYLPENRFYRYDFFYDNCASRLIDVLEASLGTIDYDSTGYPNLTFREMIRQYQAPFKWTDFGVDIALGSVIDVPMGFRDFFFLPDYVHKGLSRATFQGKKLVKEDRLLNRQKDDFGLSLIFTPGLLIGVLIAIAAGISLWDYRRKKLTRPFDFIIYLLAGLVGILVLWLWFGTAHSTTAKNYNLLWANPFFLILALGLLGKAKHHQWFNSLNLALAILVSMALVGAFVIPQSFHPLFYPIMMVIIMRLWLRYYLWQAKMTTL
jgi:hypothetical protein